MFLGSFVLLLYLDQNKRKQIELYFHCCIVVLEFLLIVVKLLLLLEWR